MAIYFRDTQFGHLVRFLSNNKVFQYPDELDPLLWRKALQRKTSLDLRPVKEQGLDLEKSKDATGSAVSTSRSRGRPGSSGQDCAVEEGEDVYLIDWYDADDPEVLAPFALHYNES